MHRRDFLITTSAAAVDPRVTLASSPVELIAQPVRARQGDVLGIRFLNQIGEGSAVHWHGLRSDNEMDAA